MRLSLRAGEKQKTSIYLGSNEVVESGPIGSLTFLVSAPVTRSSNKTEASGAVFANDGGRIELEALGGVVLPNEGELQVPQYHQGGSVVNPEYGCSDPLLGPMPCSTAAAYQNYLGRLESTLERIRRLNNPPPPLPDGPDPDGNPWTVRAEDAAGVSRYNGWEWQTFPDDWIFADNQRHDHPGLEWKYLGLVNDSEQWGWEVNDFRRLTPDEVGALNLNLRTVLADIPCGRFIDAVVKNLRDSYSAGVNTYAKSQGSILDIFGRVKAGGGFHLRTTGPEGLYNTNLISFLADGFAVDDNGKSVKYSFPKRFPVIGRAWELSQRLQTTLTLVHELIHASYASSAGGFYSTPHADMALAAQKALVDLGISKEPIPIYGSGSLYFQDALTLVCGKVKL